MNPQELKTIMGSGLLSFPITDFDAQGNFNAKSYIERLEWLAPYGASALFAAGGTGEYFSLYGEEYSQVVKTAVDTCRGKVPIIAGAGGPTRTAIAHAQEAERLGAHGILLLPHYLTEAGQEGLIEHVAQVCNSVKFGVIVYNRDRTKLTPESLQILADRCPNLIGFKDGVGNIETMSSIFMAMGDTSPTWVACPPLRCMPLPTRRWAHRCTRRPCSTSSPRRQSSSTKPCAPTTWPRSTAG